MPDDFPAPRRRGRPNKDEAKGAACVAERSASHRARLRNEAAALTHLLFLAVRALEELGDDQTNAYLFNNHPEALAATRRHNPVLADQLLNTAARAKERLSSRSTAWHGPPPPKGRRKGSVVVGGAEFWTATDGTVMRGARSTGLRINTEYNSWVLVDPKDIYFRPRRHVVGIGGKAMALLEAARIVDAYGEREARMRLHRDLTSGWPGKG